MRLFANGRDMRSSCMESFPLCDTQAALRGNDPGERPGRVVRDIMTESAGGRTWSWTDTSVCVLLSYARGEFMRKVNLSAINGVSMVVGVALVVSANLCKRLAGDLRSGFGIEENRL